MELNEKYRGGYKVEKPTMLIVSQSSTTNVGMRSYLNHIFSKYIHLETCLAADVDTERMKKADLVLSAPDPPPRMAEPLMTPKIRYLICIRTFNHTYLNRILSIPSNSEVYLVNDSERSGKGQHTASIHTWDHPIPFHSILSGLSGDGFQDPVCGDGGRK